MCNKNEVAVNLVHIKFFAILVTDYLSSKFVRWRSLMCNLKSPIGNSSF